MSTTKNKPAWLLATWFGCGYLPVGPGTWGSLAAVLIAWSLAKVGFSNWHFLALTAFMLYPAILAAGVVATESGKDDPQIVVVDEVLGQWLTLVGASRFDFFHFALAFGLFRLFDMWKPFPVNRLEALHGGTGIVMDDIMAGVYAALVLFAVGWFNHL